MLRTFGLFCSGHRAVALENVALRQLSIKEVLSAPHAPWQRAYVERVIGSIRRECLDHVLVLNEVSLRRTITPYLAYYHEWRNHLSLDPVGTSSDCILKTTTDRIRTCQSLFDFVRPGTKKLEASCSCTCSRIFHLVELDRPS